MELLLNPLIIASIINQSIYYCIAYRVTSARICLQIQLVDNLAYGI